MKKIILIFTVMVLCVASVQAQTQFIKYKNYLIPVTTSGGFNECPAGSKPRVIIDTDLAGFRDDGNDLYSDDDDIQSMIHYLVSSYRFETVGIISAPGKPETGTVADIQRILSYYAFDYDELKFKNSGYIKPGDFTIVQGLLEKASSLPTIYTGTGDQAGAQFIIDEAQKILSGEECGPLYILEWGPIANVALALKADPSIAPVLRVIASAGPGNKPPSPPNSPDVYYEYIYDNFVDEGKLWLIESNATHTAMGWYRVGQYGTSIQAQGDVKSALERYGCLGLNLGRTLTDHDNVNSNNSFPILEYRSESLKAGDSPSFLYLINNSSVNDPTSGSGLGGQFRLVSQNYWKDVAFNPGGTLGPHGNINQSGSIYYEWHQDMQNAGFGCDY